MPTCAPSWPAHRAKNSQQPSMAAASTTARSASGLLDGAPRGVRTGHGDWVSALDFSRDGHLLASGSWDKTIRVWRQDGTCVAVLQGHADPIEQVAFDFSGTRLLSRARDGDARVWRWHGEPASLVISRSRDRPRSDLLGRRCTGRERGFPRHHYGRWPKQPFHLGETAWHVGAAAWSREYEVHRRQALDSGAGETR